MGFVYGPLGAWLTALFPTQLRYTGTSIAFNAGGILGGALAPIVAQALVTGYGIASVGLYLSAAAVVSLLALIDRKSVVEGKSVAVRVVCGGRRILKKKK